MKFEDYKKDYSSIFKQKEDFEKLIKNLGMIKSLADLLEDVIIKRKIAMDVVIYTDKIVLEPSYTRGQSVLDARKIIKELFFDIKWKDCIYMIDKPTENILVRYNYVGDRDLLKLINIWVKYPNEESLPKSITKDGKCRFIEETRKIKTFVCDK